MVSAESSSVDLGPLPDKVVDPESKDDTKKDSSVTTKLSEAEAAVLCDWLTATLGPGRVRSVKTTSRLSDSPAIVTDHESGALRRMMKMLVRTPCLICTLSRSYCYCLYLSQNDCIIISCSCGLFSTIINPFHSVEPVQPRQQSSGPSPSIPRNQPQSQDHHSPCRGTWEG